MLINEDLQKSQKIYKIPKLWYNKGAGGVYIEQK
jgi:hypothetical protein